MPRFKYLNHTWPADPQTLVPMPDGLPKTYGRHKYGPNLLEIRRPTMAPNSQHLGSALSRVIRSRYGDRRAATRETSAPGLLPYTSHIDDERRFWRGGDLTTALTYDRMFPDTHPQSTGGKLALNPFGILTRRLLIRPGIVLFPPIAASRVVAVGSAAAPQFLTYAQNENLNYVPAIIPLGYFRNFRQTRYDSTHGTGPDGDRLWDDVFATHFDHRATDLHSFCASALGTGDIPDPLTFDHLMEPMPLDCMSVDQHPYVRTLLRSRSIRLDTRLTNFERVILMRIGADWVPVVRAFRALRGLVAGAAGSRAGSGCREWQDYVRHGRFMGRFMHRFMDLIYVFGWKPEAAFRQVTGFNVQDWRRLWKKLDVWRLVERVTTHIRITEKYEVPELFDACPLTILRGWWSPTMQQEPAPASPWLPPIQLVCYELETDPNDFASRYFHATGRMPVVRTATRPEPVRLAPYGSQDGRKPGLQDGRPVDDELRLIDILEGRD